MRTLVVDDKEENCYMLQSLFKGNGHEVVLARNGAEALEQLKSSRFDLVVSDILMPVMDGFELCRQVRADRFLHHIPFVFYTATYTGPQDEEFALKAGADRFVIKPCEPDSFMVIVREMMDKTTRVASPQTHETTYEGEVLKLYNERLVRKLENNMMQLEAEVQSRRKTEAVLRESEEKYRRLHESMRDAFVSVLMDGRILDSNHSYQDMLGYTVEELQTKTYLDITPEKWHSFEQKIIDEQIVPRGYSDVYEKEYIRKDGSILPVELRTFLLRSEDGKPAAMWAIVRDITDRKIAEHALRESEARFRSLIESAPEGVFVQSGGKFLFINQAMLDMLGAATAKELLGTDFLQRVAPEYHDAIRMRIQAMHDTGKAVASMEQEYLRLDGTKVPVEATAVAIQYQEQDARLVFVHDISQRKQAEAERQRLEQELLQSQKMECVGQLAGGVAHDFNNQLGGIMGFAELLYRQIDDLKQRKQIASILACGERAADLTRKLLAFSRKAPLKSVLVNIHDTIGEVVAILERSIDKRIEIRQVLKSRRPVIKGDPSQLQSALLNLSLNARDAMSGCGILTFDTETVELDKASCDAMVSCGIKPGSYVRIGITDTGCGMDAETLPHIYEPFFTTKELGKGTGLGLPAVQGTVNQHGGAIGVRSDPGKGTTFSLYFPLCEESRAEAAPAPMPQPETNPIRVLLVDDELSFQECFSAMLEACGHSVHAESDGAAALEYYKSHWQEIDLVILDLVMPKTGGSDVFHAMRAINPGAKVLLSSGYGIAGAAQALLDKGAAGFLPKPFKHAELLRAIAEAVG